MPGNTDAMNFGEMEKKGEQFLDSQQGEKDSDEVLQRAEKFADERTGDKYDQQIDKAEQFADDHIGQPDSGDQPG